MRCVVVCYFAIKFTISWPPSGDVEHRDRPRPRPGPCMEIWRIKHPPVPCLSLPYSLLPCLGEVLQDRCPAQIEEQPRRYRCEHFKIPGRGAASPFLIAACIVGIDIHYSYSSDWCKSTIYCVGVGSGGMNTDVLVFGQKRDCQWEVCQYDDTVK